MFTQWSQKSSVFHEFSEEEQLHWFDYRKDMTMHHIDSLYYTIYIDEMEKEEFYDDSEDLIGLKALLADLKKAKEQKYENRAEDLLFFGNLSVTFGSFSVYTYHLSLPECYDVFICQGCLNPDTPRMVVQLRTHFLVNEMLCLSDEAVLESLKDLRAMLASYGIQIRRVEANRIDYAFHTNIIQNMTRFFSQSYLENHMNTTLRRYGTQGRICGTSRPLELDYLCFGRRTSNKVFVRIYNKTQEVIQMQYKSFFFHYWRSEGLISEYDLFVLEEAYKRGSYISGVLVGRIKWYLAYGKDESLKAELEKLLHHDYINSDNCQDIEKRIDGILPPLTLIVNIEYQVKKDFFSSLGELVAREWDYTGTVELKPVMTILHFTGDVINYLTDTLFSFKNYDGSYCHWWKRLRGSALQHKKDFQKLVRTYSRTMDAARSRHRLLGSVASCAIMNTGERDFESIEGDIADALCDLNDNDVRRWHEPNLVELPDDRTLEDVFSRRLILVDETSGESVHVSDFGYAEIRQRRARQYRRYLKGSDEDADE